MPVLPSPSTDPLFRAGVGRLFAVVAVASMFLCIAMPVFAQEAYYWTYSRHPDLSYFDHPPMVAWTIWLGTQVFGHGPLGLRIGMVLCGLGSTLAGLLLVRRFGLDRNAQRGWILLALAVPLYVLTHFYANPDAPLLLGWSIALWALWRVRETGGIGWWILAGAAAGFGLLAKYSASFLAVGGVLLLLFDPRYRRQLRTPGPWIGVLCATLVFAPVILWNLRNHFESFRFQTEGRWSRGSLGTRWLGEFVVNQLLGYHPALAILTIPVIVWLWRRMRAGDPRAGFLLAFGVPMPAFFLVNSLFIQVKINWLLPAYMPLLIGTLMWWRETEPEARLPRLSRSVRCAVAWTPFLIALAPLAHVWPQGGGSSWKGWDELAPIAMGWKDKIDAEDGVRGNVFFFCSDYKDAAQLGRSLFLQHCRSGSKEPLAPMLAQNVFGETALQFDHWESPRDHIGQDAIYVLPRAEDRPREVEKITRHFRKVEMVYPFELKVLGVRQMYADVYVCRGYLGP
ncbi:MAG: glycosyltransferase family 39 protein [Planctomycetota bacterium]